MILTIYWRAQKEEGKKADGNVHRRHAKASYRWIEMLKVVLYLVMGKRTRTEAD
jgi:hypothetical protein